MGKAKIYNSISRIQLCITTYTCTQNVVSPCLHHHPLKRERGRGERERERERGGERDRGKERGGVRVNVQIYTLLKQILAKPTHNIITVPST